MLLYMLKETLQETLITRVTWGLGGRLERSGGMGIDFFTYTFCIFEPYECSNHKYSLKGRHSETEQNK